MTEINPFEQAYHREHKIRLKAEKLLEDKSRELYLQNCRLEESLNQLKQQQAHMLTQDKLATLGTLSAGIAHEVNNPLSFVKSNFESLGQYLQTFESLLVLINRVKPKLSEEVVSEIDAFMLDQDIEFMQEDLLSLMADTSDGISRVTDIIQNLRSFARTQPADQCEFNIVDGLKSTLKLLNSELVDKVVVDLDLKPVSDVACNPNEINQVLLNLIINAKQATDDTDQPTIRISTWEDSEYVHLKISDNGCGMDQETQQDIFVPFFTTKPVGKGTGMGLAISYNIIKDHNGRIEVESQPDHGSHFTVSLPIK